MNSCISFMLWVKIQSHFTDYVAQIVLDLGTFQLFPVSLQHIPIIVNFSQEGGALLYVLLYNMLQAHFIYSSLQAQYQPFLQGALIEFQWRMVFIDQDLDTDYACCYWSFIMSSPFQWTEQENTYMYTFGIEIDSFIIVYIPSRDIPTSQ